MAYNESDQRSYKRVFFNLDSGKGGFIEGASVHWKDFGVKVPVYDISYRGAALGLDPAVNVKLGKEYSIELLFLAKPPMQLSAEVRWVGEKVIGVYFEKLDANNRLMFEEFISDKLIGAHLRLVEKEHYKSNIDCSFWYQGPNNTNVYIWVGLEGLLKVVVDFDGQEVVCSEGKVAFSGDPNAVEGYNSDNIEQNDTGDVGQARNSENDLKNKALNVISQLHNHLELLKPAFEVLKK